MWLQRGWWAPALPLVQVEAWEKEGAGMRLMGLLDGNDRGGTWLPRTSPLGLHLA